MPNAILDAARRKRDAAQQTMEALTATAEAREEPGFIDDEFDKFTEARGQRDGFSTQVTDLEAEEARSEKASAAAATLAQGEAVIGYEPGTYRKDASIAHGEPSYMRDLACATVSFGAQLGNQQNARERLTRNWTEVQRDAEQGEHKGLATRIVDEVRRWGAAPDVEQRVNPNTTDGTGGEFVPPLWLVNQYVPFARAGRRIANRIPTHPLPPGTDSINLPKILTGSTTAIQAAQADAVSSTDITTSTVTAAVNTIAGQQDISLQLLEQSPLSMDGVIFEDLAADYDMQLDRQVIKGTGSNGQHKGIYGQTAASANSATSLNTDAAKINAVTCASVLFWDGTTATSFTQHRSILNAVTNIETLRFRSPSVIHAHPRRVNHWQTASDSTIGRPLFTAYNVVSGLGRPTANEAEGACGELVGIPVVKDANIPILCATGSLSSGTGDMIGLTCEDDLILWEGTLRMRALPEVLSGTLQVRFQVYAYSAFMPNRFPACTTLITGTTGLAAASY